MIRAYPVVGKQKSIDICQAFIDGAPKTAKGFVFYGVNETNFQEWRRARVGPHPWYYIDNSFFDVTRGKQFRIAKNRVQTQPYGQVSDGKRFEALGLEIAPMNARPHHTVLAIEQSASFMRYVAERPDWLADMTHGFATVTTLRRWSADKLKQQASLPEALGMAATVVTHSSAAAVTATLLGIPCIVSQLSALARMKWSTHPEHDDRLQYMQVLADNCWTLDEIREGKAWAWLNQK